MLSYLVIIKLDGTMQVAIAFSATGVCILSMLSFIEIVEILNFLYAFAALFEVTALCLLCGCNSHRHADYLTYF